MRVTPEKSIDDNESEGNFSNSTKTAAYIALAICAASIVSNPSLAGTTGTELQGVYTSVNELLAGYGGRIIVAGGMAASAIIGYIRQSIAIAGTGIGLSLLVANAPAIADGMVSATI